MTNALDITTLTDDQLDIYMDAKPALRAFLKAARAGETVPADGLTPKERYLAARFMGWDLAAGFVVAWIG